LYTRAIKRISQFHPRGGDKSAATLTPGVRDSSNPSLITFLSAISCCLPSIARAQVEISGKAVPERDEKGGSMIDRTRRLFTSLLFDTLGLDDYSEAKDKEIFNTNIATYTNRLSSLRGTKQSSFSSSEQVRQFGEPSPESRKSRSKKQVLDFSRTIKLDDMTPFQKNALERFLLYVDVLQQENAIIKKFLTQHPELLKEYEKESNKLAKEYLALPVNKLRKKLGIKDYKLEVKKYI